MQKNRVANAEAEEAVLELNAATRQKAGHTTKQKHERVLPTSGSKAAMLLKNVSLKETPMPIAACYVT